MDTKKEMASISYPLFFLLFFLFLCLVRKGPLQLHLRDRRARLPGHLCPAQFDGRLRCLRRDHGQRPRLLPPAHGGPFRH